VTGQLALTPEQIADQMALPEAEWLRVFDACKIIYPGKNHNAWWDLEQLREQTIDAVNIFEYLHPDKVGVWLFDCSLAHEGLAVDALNVNNMNVNPRGKQKLLRDTIIPLNNPPPQPGKVDTRGMPQSMVFSQDHPDKKLWGVVKGMKEVLRECESAWDELTKRCGKVVGKCKACTTSQIKNDAEQRIAEAKAMGQESSLTDAKVAEASSSVPSAPQNEWCCAYWVLSLQDDFVNKKPGAQRAIRAFNEVS
jgi:hypothetical protein